MKTLRPLFLALAASPLLLALDHRADPVSFHPADGSSLTKEFGIVLDVSIGDITMAVDGMDMSQNIPDDVGFNVEFEMEVSDEYVMSAGGKPLDLIRSFEGLSGFWEGSGGGESESGEVEGFAELEDQKVRFKWDEDSEEYVKSYHESEGDEDLLTGLDVDMDLRALLPAEEVDTGDTWTVSGEELERVFLFGANFDELGEGDDELAGMIEDELMPQFEALAEDFTFQCEYKGTRDADGATVAVIAVTIEGEGDLDLTGAIETAIDAQVPEGMEFEIAIANATLSMNVEGSGELLWNQTAGLLHAFEMDATFEFLADVDIEVDAQGETHSMEAAVELLGDGEWSASAG